jgi:peptidoglycan/xylan/chitin deacetylase (PgdA/CDA1 family)
MTIKLPIAAVAKYLQNPTAQKLANLPKPPEPKPEPTPTPAAPAPAPITGNKVITLTFDDGLGPYTAQLLDILDQHGAKATFFLIGSKVSARADVLRRIHARSHPGAIILMHDIHQTSVNAVPCILSALKQQGYSFVTVQGLLGSTTPGSGYP